MKPIPPEIRFWNKVNKRGPLAGKLGRCWIWIGYVKPKAYGKGQYGLFNEGHKTVVAHTFALKLDGRICPNGMQPHHKCWRQQCVRSSHIEFLTPQKHSEIHKRKSHCIHGHKFSGSVKAGRGKKGLRWNICKICRATAQRRFREKRNV